MPQFDNSSFIVQYVWVFFSFLSFYFVFVWIYLQVWAFLLKIRKKFGRSYQSQNINSSQIHGKSYSSIKMTKLFRTLINHIYT